MTVPAWTMLVRNQFLGFVREPAAAGFNLLVPFFIVVVQAIAFGTTDIGPDLPGYRIVDTLPISAATMFVMIIGVFGMGIGLSAMLESRTIAGCKLRPGGVGSVLSSYATVLFLLTLIGLVLSIGVLVGGWQIGGPDHPVLVVLFTALGSVLFMGVGACGAATGGSPRSAQALSSMLFFPLLFLSGAMFPLDSFPAPLQAVAHLLPSYHLYELFSFSWLPGQNLPMWSLVYVSVAAAVFATGAWFLFNRREDV